MKVVILAGGLGTRLSEETTVKPKPMAEIGDRPILWHILKTYSHFGHNEFVICLGYKGYVIKEWFSNYFLHNSDVTFDLENNGVTVHQNACEPWKVSLIDTGADTMTGGRLRRVREYVEDDTFMLTYGDGVADVDIGALIDFHRAHGRVGTVTAVQPPGRFGSLAITPEGDVTSFQEKPIGDGAWINGGFFVFEPEFLDRLESDADVLEREPLEDLAADGQLSAYRHPGFWQPMDTMRDKRHLEDLWDSGSAPWKVW
jgi:glucose-1-phosphate cytidylyltransferase